MSSTLTAELARLSHDALLLVELEGTGRRINHDAAGATSLPYALTNVAVAGDSAGTLNVDRLIPCLTELPQTLSERLDLDAGSVDLGQIQIGLRHAAVPSPALAAQGWSSLADLLAYGKTDDSWTLESAVTAAAASCHYAPAATDPAEHTVLWIGSEAVLVDAVDPVTHVITWTRGVLGTTAQAHVPWPTGDGYLHARPRHWKGRRVTVRLLLRDWSVEPSPSTGRWYAVPYAQAVVLWSGVIQDARVTTPGEVQLSCRSAMARLNRAVGRRQWEGEVTGFNSAGIISMAEMAEATVVNQGWYLNVRLPAEARQRVPDREPVDESGVGTGPWHRDLICRFGDQLCEVRVKTNSTAADASIIDVLVLAWQCLDTADPSLVNASDPTEKRPLREVLVTSAKPRKGRSYLSTETPILSFGVAGDPTEHPVDFLLNLGTSTGRQLGVNGAFDYAPGSWGLGLALADFDLDSFRAVKNDTEGITFPGLVLGADGQHPRLLDWWTEQVGRPFGWMVHLDRLGRYRLTRLRDCYPRDVVWTIESEYVVQGSISLHGEWDQTASLQRIRTAGPPLGGDCLRTRQVWPPEAVERLDADDSEITIDCPGLPYGDAAGEAALTHRSQQLARWWCSPLPTISLSLHLRYLASVQLGDLVELGDIQWLDLASGARTLDGTLALVVEVGLDVASASIRLGLRQVPAAPVGYHAPSAYVEGYDAPTLTVTVGEHYYVDDLHTGATGTCDARSFVVGEKIALYTSTGVPRCDVAATVASVTDTTIVLVGAFRSGGIAVAPAAGNIITYPRWETGTAPAAVWLTAQQDCVAQADGSLTPPSIAASGALPYTYGG